MRDLTAEQRQANKLNENERKRRTVRGENVATRFGEVAHIDPSSDTF